MVRMILLACPLVPEPVGSDPVGSEPVGSVPVGSEPVGSDPVGSEPVGSFSVIDSTKETACSNVCMQLNIVCMYPSMYIYINL